MINVIFLILYIIATFFDMVSGEFLYYAFSFHLILLIISHLQKKVDIINPIFIFYIGAIIVNIANISLIGQVEAQHIRTYKYIIPKYIDQAAEIWCISNAVLIIGYEVFSTRSFTNIDIQVNKRKVLQNIFYCLIFANVLSIFGHGINVRGNQLGKIFGLVNTIGILFFARLWAAEDDKTYRTYALSLFAIETYIALVSSYLRFELILPTFYLFTGYFIGKRHIKYLFSYRVLPLIVVIILFSSVFSLLQSNRSNFINVFSGEVTNDPTTESSGTLFDRSANLAQLTNIVNLVKQNGFYDGRASAPILTALIPRALWPEKPLIQLGAWFALEIGVAYKAEGGRANNSINMTVPGELYLDFGWIGVIIGSLLFGAFISVLWNSTRFYSSEHNLTGTIFGGYLLILSIGSYGDLQIVLTLLSTYLMFYFIKKIVKV